MGKDIHMKPLDPAEMDDSGARALASAILLKAAQDYWYVCDFDGKETVLVDEKNPTQNALRTRHMLEKFFNSDWYDVLSDIDKDRFMDTIKKIKAKGWKLPTMLEIENGTRRFYDNTVGRAG